MYNFKEIDIIKKIYNFIKLNSKKNIPSTFKSIGDKFNLEIEQVKHFIHLIHYKYNLPILFEIGTIKDKKSNKTLCYFCKKKHGKFHPLKSEIEITADGTKIPGIFVCDECYNTRIKK